jgi:hypothetical protein
MRSNARLRLFLASGSVLVAVCSTPASPCACEPNRTHILVYGNAKNSSGTPVAGAAVFVIRPHLGAPINDPFLSPDHATATTATDGNYRIDLITLESPSSLPVVVLTAAVRAPSDTVRLPGFGGLLRPVGQRPDSVEVNFVFP